MLENQNAMMVIAVAIGVAHLSLANLMSAFHTRKNLRWLGHLGWAMLMIGAFLIGSGMMTEIELLRTIGVGLASVGGISILLFSSDRPLLTFSPKTHAMRLVDGVMQVTNLSKAFGDVLSYLRLFALGLASAKLAITFNDLAGGMLREGWNWNSAGDCHFAGRTRNQFSVVFDGGRSARSSLELHRVFQLGAYPRRLRLPTIQKEGESLMDTFALMLGWAGIYGPTALGAIGSIIGCARAGQAACGAMLDVESGYGRFIGLSALPSSQIIYGIVVMFTLNREVTTESAPGLFGGGNPVWAGIDDQRAYQGTCCASAIVATKTKPEVFGLSAAPAAIVEGFAVFAFIFALVIAGGIPNPGS